MKLTPGECQKLIAEAMDEYLLGLPDDTLHSPIRHLLGIEGKRMRPSLTLLGCALFGGDVAKVKNAALAIEVFHNFTLMHDDIMDNAPLRRGQVTVHEKWNVNSAILSGDAMLVESYRLLCKSSPELLPKILPVFNQVALDVCLGQQLDMDYERKNIVSESEYLEMIRLKTSVLLGAALQIGAIAGDASSEDQEHLSKFGTGMGMAFQLWDDYLDAYGDAALFGKQRGGDILADKKTILYVCAYHKADEMRRKKLDELHGNKHISAQQKVDEVISIYDEMQTGKEVKSKMEFYRHDAMCHLAAISVPGEEKAALALLAENIFNRKH